MIFILANYKWKSEMMFDLHLLMLFCCVVKCFSKPIIWAMNISEKLSNQRRSISTIAHQREFLLKVKIRELYLCAKKINGP